MADRSHHLAPPPPEPDLPKRPIHAAALNLRRLSGVRSKAVIGFGQVHTSVLHLLLRIRIAGL